MKIRFLVAVFNGAGQGTLIAATDCPASTFENPGFPPPHPRCGESGFLDFGELEPLVRYLQKLADKPQAGPLVSAIRNAVKASYLGGALANARTFAHGVLISASRVFERPPPALHSAPLKARQRTVPRHLGALYRNTNRIGENGGRSAEGQRARFLPVDAEPVTVSRLGSGESSCGRNRSRADLASLVDDCMAATSCFLVHSMQ